MLPPLLRLSLRDGTQVALRPVVPEDRARLLDAFDQLSETSRRFRFLGSVSSLSDAQLRYLTDTDGVDHVAWGALDVSDLDAPGFGIGRWIRLTGTPHVAEFSLTVLDDVQGRGIGQLLLAVLAVVAEPLGVETLRGYVARDNVRMVTWMQALGATSSDASPDVVFDLPVPPDPAASSSAREFVEQMDRVRAAMEAQRADGDG